MEAAGLTVVDGATAEMCGQVIYPAAVLNCGEQPEAAQAFLDYLCTADALACFEGVGFSPSAPAGIFPPSWPSCSAYSTWRRSAGASAVGPAGW